MVAAQTATKLSTKGQIVIPKDVRDRLGWGPGDEILVEETSDSIVLRLVHADRIDPEVAQAEIDQLKRQLAKHPAYRGPPLTEAALQRAARAGAAAGWSQDARGAGRRRRR